MTDKPRDELLERYAEAVAQDARGPSDRVRNAARAHAQMLRDQAAVVQRAAGATPPKPAANQPQWTLSLVASLAVVGLAGLLYVQIDHGTPEDREVALGVPAISDIAPAPAPAPATATATARAYSGRTEVAQAADTRQRADGKALEGVSAAAAPPLAVAPAKNAIADTTDKKAAPTHATAPLPDAPQAAGNVAAAKPQADAPPTEADAVQRADANRATGNLASAGGMRDAHKEARAEALPRAAAPMVKSAAAPAALATAPPPPPAPAAVAAPPGDVAPAIAARVRPTQVNPAAAQFLEAARSGQTETMERLLSQGISVNTRDDGGNTALMLAVTHQQGPAVRRLLAMGADPSLVNREGFSALQLANRLALADMAKLLQTPR